MAVLAAGTSTLAARYWVLSAIKPPASKGSEIGSDSCLFDGLEHCRDLGVHTVSIITIHDLDSINAIGPAPPRD
jgi:hypothetical protein